MKPGTMKICTFMGALGGTLMFVGLWPIAHLFPPLDPNMPAVEVAAYYRDHQTGILVGGIFIMAASALFFPFVGVLAAFMKKIEGPVSPLTYAFMMVCAAGFTSIYFAGVFLTAAAYRPGFSPEVINIISDLAFIALIIPVFQAFVQNVLTAVVILGDTREQPILPRWVAYMNLWTGVLFLPSAVIGLFKDGPFAWNGALAFWLAAIVFGIWFNAMVAALLGAIKRDAISRP
jgi:hypothetical protein